MPAPLIILGESTRAAAQSAIAAGYAPWCVDLRGDRDLLAIAPTRRCSPDQFPTAILRMLDEAPPAAPVLFTGPLENHADVVRALGFERELLGGTADAILKARDPLMLTTLKPVKGMKFPSARANLSLLGRLRRMIFGGMTRMKYLRKPRASFGGVGIEWWEPGGTLGRDHYAQQFVRGEPYTAIYHADGWSAFLLGVVEQIVGEPAFGGSGFRGCGYVGPAKFTEKGRAALMHLGVQLTQRLDLRGVFSVDLIMDFNGLLWPVEVNPRYSAACEVLERSEGVLTVTGKPADAPKTTRARPTVMWGKAMLFARTDVTTPDLYEVLPRDGIADVPQIGRPVKAGEQLCTVFTAGRTRDEVREKLKAAAQQVYTHVERGAVAAK